jgi:predicted RNA binding protein YcfA (HicA-like mRNA interferase family)
MTRLPQITSSELLAALKRGGFEVVRIRGSHHFLRHMDDPTRQTVIALHSGDMKQGTLRDVLEQARLTPAELILLP